MTLPIDRSLLDTLRPLIFAQLMSGKNAAGIASTHSDPIVVPRKLRCLPLGLA